MPTLLKLTGCLSAAATILLLLLSAVTSQDPTIEKGPYVLNYPDYFGNKLFIPSDNPTTKEGVYLGRVLFYEPMLSLNNKISCASCHQQKKAFTDGLRFSEGINGEHAERNSMSLANLAWVNNFFWDGRVKGLEQQVMFPMTSPHEMGQSMESAAKKLQSSGYYRRLFKTVFGKDAIAATMIEQALAQFERTLISANAPYDKYLRGQYSLSDDEKEGLRLFMEAPNPQKNIRGANCGRCHGTPKMFIELFHNNGLDSLPLDIGREKLTGNATDRGRFRVPTLRNIALTAPYMHDGRFKTLEEVVDHYNGHLANAGVLSPLLQNVSNDVNGATLGLTAKEKQDIISFLQLLTDNDFISDHKFSDPHQH